MMKEMTDENILKDFKKNLVELKDNVDGLRKKFNSRVIHGWDYNPVFDKKLEIHRSILDLENQQKELADGIIALLEVISQAELEKKRRIPLPPAPRPSRRHFIQ